MRASYNLALLAVRTLCVLFIIEGKPNKDICCCICSIRRSCFSFNLSCSTHGRVVKGLGHCTHFSEEPVGYYYYYSLCHLLYLGEFMNFKALLFYVFAIIVS